MNENCRNQSHYAQHGLGDRVGTYDYDRWKSGWQKLFDTHRLAHNHREIKRIEISKEGDGAFAVVDIDTLWIAAAGEENHWKGRVCKVYARTKGVWKMTMQTGVLDYSLVKITSIRELIG
jgi:ketosteroid isomerase-like protein